MQCRLQDLKPLKSLPLKTYSSYFTFLEDSEFKNILSIVLKSDTYAGSDGESGMRNRILLTFLAAGHETATTSMT